MTRTVTEFPLIEQGIYFAASWPRNILIHSMIIFWECNMEMCPSSTVVKKVNSLGEYDEEFWP